MHCLPKVGLCFVFLLGKGVVLAGKRMTARMREQLADLFESGVSWGQAARIVSCNLGSAQDVCNRWRLHGRLVLMNKPVQTRYPFEVKLEAVTRFLRGETAMSIAKNLQLASPSTVHHWVRVYRLEGESGLHNKPRGRRPSTPRSQPQLQSQEQARAQEQVRDRVVQEQRDEIDRLRKRLYKLEMEHAILKGLRDLARAREY